MTYKLCHILSYHDSCRRLVFQLQNVHITDAKYPCPSIYIFPRWKLKSSLCNARTWMIRNAWKRPFCHMLATKARAFVACWNNHWTYREQWMYRPLPIPRPPPPPPPPHTHTCYIVQVYYTSMPYLPWGWSRHAWANSVDPDMTIWNEKHSEHHEKMAI